MNKIQKFSSYKGHKSKSQKSSRKTSISRRSSHRPGLRNSNKRWNERYGRLRTVSSLSLHSRIRSKNKMTRCTSKKKFVFLLAMKKATTSYNVLDRSLFTRNFHTRKSFFLFFVVLPPPPARPLDIGFKRTFFWLFLRIFYTGSRRFCQRAKSQAGATAVLRLKVVRVTLRTRRRVYNDFCFFFLFPQLHFFFLPLTGREKSVARKA